MDAAKLNQLKAFKPYVVEESDDEVEDTPSQTHTAEEEEEPEIVESDMELDESGVVEPDDEQPQQMGDSSVEVTEENRDASQESKMQAMEAISDGKLEEAIEHLTKAIMLNPTSAIMYATRATVYIKMKKPNAAIRDASAALEPLSREEAAKDLHVASKLDYDEEISDVLKKAKKKEQSSSSGGMPGEVFPGGPELMSAFKDPEVMAALQDVMKNPANLEKHQANPKVAPIIKKMMGKFAGSS
ncbi:hypothetical protein Leryth_023222 [Lithospermum erythrorhizon]|nr:hypothetical protein Leryth_023222 [Lithospermum erythrorhizon]